MQTSHYIFDLLHNYVLNDNALYTYMGQSDKDIVLALARLYRCRSELMFNLPIYLYLVGQKMSPDNFYISIFLFFEFYWAILIILVMVLVMLKKNYKQIEWFNFIIKFIIFGLIFQMFFIYLSRDFFKYLIPGWIFDKQLY